MGPPPAWGLGVAVALMVLAMAVPAATGWYVHVHSFPPLHAEWDPRVGPGTLPALVLAVLGLAQRAVASPTGSRGGGCCCGCSPRACSGCWRWRTSTARAGSATSSTTSYEYLRTARATTDLHATLQEYVGRIRARPRRTTGRRTSRVTPRAR